MALHVNDRGDRTPPDRQRTRADAFRDDATLEVRPWPAHPAGRRRLAFGLRFLSAPSAGAAGYGLSAGLGQDDGFLLAKGLRDFTAGLFVFTLVATASRRVADPFMMVATVIPIGDVVIVATHAALQPLPLSIHGGTAAFMAVLAVFLISGARGSDKA